jgi:hypothetical protein
MYKISSSICTYKPYYNRHNNIFKYNISRNCFTKNVRKHVFKCTIKSLLSENLVATCAAVVSKSCSCLVAFPLESLKIHRQLHKKVNDIMDLYIGVRTILCTHAIKSFVSYITYFSIINMMSVNYPIHQVVIYAGLLSCFLTSFIRVPLQFVNRNIIVMKEKNLITIFNKIRQEFTFDIYKRCWCLVIMNDMPEIIIKVLLNAWLLQHFPTIDHFSRNCIISIIESILSAPLDYIITHTFCKFHKTPFNIFNCINGLQYKVMSCILGQFIFNKVFQTLQPSRFY